MKRTVSVNIKGINFMIEEDAYENLQSYMNRLETILSNQEGKNEIIEDVELRIAEICSSKISDTKTVIETEDINEILEQLGDPSLYVDEEIESNQTSFEQTKQTSEKRLFRDVENGMIGGVCEGLANYFNIDTTVMRGIFLLILFFAGFGIPLYIILWIIIPKAENTIDRLRMKGKPITVESVKNEVELAGERLKNGTKKMASKIEAGSKKRFSWIGKIIRFGFGSFLILWGLVLLIAFAVIGFGEFQIVPIDNNNGYVSFQQIGELIMHDTNQLSTLKTGFLILGFGIVMFLFLSGFTLITKMKNKWSKFSLFGLLGIAIIGAVICSVIGVRIGKEYAFDNGFKEEIGVVQNDTLRITRNHKKEFSKKGHEIDPDNNGFMKINKDSILIASIEFKYRTSEDSLFHIKREFEARGKTNKTALENAENISHYMQLDSSNLIMDNFYIFPIADKIRNQEVTVWLEIPKNGKLFIDDELIEFEEEKDSNRKRRKYKRRDYDHD